jgi:S1-C subfamily serine protease
MPGQVELDHTPPLPPPALEARQQYHPALPGAYRVVGYGRNGARRLDRHAAPDDDDFDDDDFDYDEQPVPHESDDASPAQVAAVALVSAVLVPDRSAVPLVIAVPAPVSPWRRLSEAGKRLLPKNPRRRPSSSTAAAGDNNSDSQQEDSSRQGPPALPGAYLVVGDNENPDAEILVRAAPVAPTPAGRLRNLLRRLVLLNIQLGRSRDGVEADVQGIQRRIDIQTSNLSVEASPQVVGVDDGVPPLLTEREHVDGDGSSAQSLRIAAQDVSLAALDETYARQFLSVPAKNGDGTPLDPRVANDEMYARQFLRVPAKNEDGKPRDPRVAKGRDDAKPAAWGRPTKEPLIKDDDDDAPSVSGSGTARRTSSSGAAPSRGSPEDELRAAQEEIQRLRVENTTLRNEKGLLRLRNERLSDAKRFLSLGMELLGRAHQEELQTAEDKYRASLAAKDVELQQKDSELAAARADGQQRGAKKEAEREAREAEREASEAKLEASEAKVREQSDEILSLRDERQSTHHSHQAELRTAKDEYAGSTELKDVELQKMKRELVEARAERKRLEEKQGEFEQRLAAMSGLLEAIAAESPSVNKETPRRFDDSSLNPRRKRRRVLEVSHGCGECESRSSSYPFHVDCDSEDSFSDTLDSECSASFDSFYDDASDDDQERSVVSCRAQIWSEQDVRHATAVCDELTQREVLAKINLKEDVSTEFSYPFRPEDVQWAEAVALCHTWHFPSGAPSGMMGKVLRNILQTLRDCCGDGCLRLKHVACYRSSLVLFTDAALPDPSSKNLLLLPGEILVALVDKESSLCIDTQGMTSESQRLIFCSKGFVGDSGQPIRRGGHEQVLAAIHASLREVNVGPQEVVCPMCLQSMHPHKADTWNHDLVTSVASRTVNCRHGHRVDATLICGPGFRFTQVPNDGIFPMRCHPVLAESPRSVVMVAVFNPISKRPVSVGSGFVVDKNLGLILTAAHTVKDEPRYRKRPWHRRQYCIGLETDDGVEFCYTAEITGICLRRVDACILRITGPAGNGRKHTPLLSGLQELPLASEWHMEENVRLVGYNQGGEGEKGTALDRQRDVLRGYICKLHESRINGCTREEIVVAGDQVIQGHSGGPCVNSSGEVLGLLSRSDCYNGRRWYLVPFTKLLPLVEAARERC